jgi:hypothetical protein
MGGRYAIRRLMVGSVTALGLDLLSGCAAGRPTSLIRLPEGYEGLNGALRRLAAGDLPTCARNRDPADEEAWGFRARPAANARWREPEVFYAVGSRARGDDGWAGLATPSEACWGPVSFRRE